MLRPRPERPAPPVGWLREDLIFPLDGEDHTAVNRVQIVADVFGVGKKRGVLLLNVGDGADRARRGRGADVCSVDPGDSSRSCPRAAPESQPEGPFEAHMKSLFRDR